MVVQRGGYRCRICTSEQADEIDAAIRAGETYTSIALQYSLTHSNVSRHARRDLGVAVGIGSRLSCRVCVGGERDSIELAILEDPPPSVAELSERFPSVPPGSIKRHRIKCMGYRVGAIFTCPICEDTRVPPINQALDTLAVSDVATLFNLDVDSTSWHRRNHLSNTDRELALARQSFNRLDAVRRFVEQ